MAKIKQNEPNGKTKSVQAGAEGSLTPSLDADDVSLLVTRHALNRAVSLLDVECKRRGLAVGSLPAGGYPVALNASIRGDITVGQPGVSVREPEPDVTDRDVLCAMLHGKSLKQVRAVLDKAVEILRACRAISPRKIKAAQAIKTELGVAGDHYDLSLKDACAGTELMSEPREIQRAGAVSGKPMLSIEGHTGEHAIDVRVEPQSDVS